MNLVGYLHQNFIKMEHIKFVIDELNQAPFNQNLNLIAYDNLRDEQRLDLLIQILNVIDSKVFKKFYQKLTIILGFIYS